MTFSIQAQKRLTGQAAELRAVAMVPGVVYGGDRNESVSIAVKQTEFEKLYHEAGESSLIDFHVDGEAAPVKVLVQDVQFDPVRGQAIHVDFRQIKMNEEMSAPAALTFIGEAPAVKELGGTLMKTLDYVDIMCLPKDLVSEIQIDLSVLKTFDDAVRVTDLVLPPGIKVAANNDQIIVKVSPPLTEEQLKAMEETASVDIANIEVEKKGKKEEEVEAEKK